MLRKLGVVGLGVPLVAIVGALIYLFLFGTSAPTFEAATRELARDHTVLRIREEPPAALIVPTQPRDSVILIVVLPDDDRHVWSATQALGVLDYVDSHGLAVIPVSHLVDRDQLTELAGLAAEFVTPRDSYVAGFSGSPISALCDGELGDGWSGVIIVAAGPTPVLDQCTGLPFLRIDDQSDPGARIVQWIVEPQ